ncbi:MAG TPA: prepilin-type N-terminal cleavage/methylation domain-containing protein [Phycisphaerales bacterium]|nr:prepilin-type N-terminal cleavage/methylation domain-containing protein [Phycisphaerales bacterium]
MQRRHASIRAFTLIELSIVLVVVGVVAAVSVPRYAESRSRYQVELAARKVCVDATYVQNDARYGSATRAIEYDLPTDTYKFAYAKPGSASSENALVILRDEPFRVTLLKADFNSAPVLTFNGFGVPVAGGALAVGTNTRGKSITVDPDTGAVTTATLDAATVKSLTDAVGPAKVTLTDGDGKPKAPAMVTPK